MYIDYDDITSRISEAPIWWLNGVPRYEPFHPHLAAIYGTEIALIWSRCQHCHRRFDVAVFRTELSIRDHIALYGQPDVGDPPSHECEYGNAMRSEQIELLEYWRRVHIRWQRMPDLEGLLSDADDPSRAPKPMVAHLRAAGSEARYDAAWRSDDQIEMAAALSSAGFDRPDYYAQLIIARKEVDILKRAIIDALAFTRED
jgi:hypothetical protein